MEVLRYTNNAPNSDATVAAFKKKDGYTVYARGYTHTNCHAYTWAGTTSVWLAKPGKYLSDGSYKKVGSRIRPTSPYQKKIVQDILQYLLGVREKGIALFEQR